MKKQTTKTMKKGLSLFLAVLMCLSAWVWVEPEHNHVHASGASNATQVANTNTAALDSITGLNTDVTTVYGEFANDYEDANNTSTDAANYATAYKNVLYSPKIQNNDDYAASKIKFKLKEENVTSIYLFHPETTFMYDGVTTPSTGIVVRQEGLKSGTLFSACKVQTYCIAVDSSTANGLSFENRMWRGDDGKLKFMWTYFGKGDCFSSDVNITASSSYMCTRENKGNWFFANILSFTGSMADNEFIKTITPTYIYKGKQGSESDLHTHTFTSTRPFHVINYKPLKAAIEDAISFIPTLKEIPQKYTTASVQAYVDAVKGLVNAKPNNFVNASSNNPSGYASAASAAIQAYNTAKAGLTVAAYTISFMRNDGTLAAERTLDYGSSIDCSDIIRTAINSSDVPVDASYHKTYSWDTSKYVTIVVDDVTIGEVETTAQHTSNAGEITKKATCTEAGVKTFTCTSCYGVIRTETINASGHDFKNAKTKETKAATCTEANEYVYLCNTCGAESTKNTGSALGHDFTSGEYLSSVSGKDGRHYQKCKRCEAYGIGTEKDKTEEHKWNNGVETSAPTCETEGVKTYTCSLCGDTYTEKIEATGHNFTGDLVKDENGHSCKCANSECDATGYVDENGNHVKGQLQHTWDNGTVKTPATCDDKGTTTYKCTVCGQTKDVEDIKALGHNYDTNGDGEVTDADGKVETAATCETNGELKFTCQREGCNDSYTKEIPATGHNFTGEWVSHTDGENGDHYKKCKNNCGKFGLVVNGEQKVGECEKHNFTSEVTKEPTCTDKGVRTYTCKECKNKYTEDIPANGHNYDTNDDGEVTVDDGEVTTKPTCTTTGTRTYTCTVCGDKTKTEVVDALGHNFNGVYKEETEGKDGTHSRKCERCDEYGLNEGESANHDWKLFKTDAATCENTGLETYECTLCKSHSYTKVIPVLGHDRTTHEAKDAGNECGALGNYAYETCSRCDKIWVTINGAETEATNADKDENGIPDAAEYTNKQHSMETVPAVPSTCQVHGTIEYYHCTNCNKNYKFNTGAGELADLEESIKAPLKDHDFSPWVSNGKNQHTRKCKTCKPDVAEVKVETQPCSGGEATCIALATCSVCSAPYGKIDPENHKNKITVEQEDPTCQKKGTTSYVYCGDCNNNITDPQEIPTVSHEYGDWKSNGDGTHTRTCKNCVLEGGRIATETEDCHGGEATCLKLAVCDDCKAEYGSLDENNHKQLTIYSKVDSTCTKVGHEAYEKCACGNYTTYVEIPMKPHTYGETFISDKNGKHYKKCTECGTPNDSVSCTFGDWYKNNNGTHSRECNDCGYVETKNCTPGEYQFDAEHNQHYKVCTTCGYETERGDCNFSAADCVTKATCSTCNGTTGEFDSANHKSETVMPKKEATCQYAGYEEYRYCSACNEILEDIIPIPQKEHNYGEWTPVKENGRDIGYHTSTCITCKSENGEVSFVKEKCAGSGEATCSTRQKCDKCHGEFGLNDMTKHTGLVTVEKKDATCQSEGYEAYSYCKDCGTDINKKVTIPKKNHSYGEWVSNNNGTHTRTCTTCVGEDIAEQTENCSGGVANCVDKKVCETCNGEYGEFDVTAHKKPVTVDEVAATCQTPGTTSYRKCEACGINITEPKVIPVVAHKFGAWVSDGEGTHTRTCETCVGEDKAKENGTCSGGTAYCDEQATCELCHTKYGDVDSNKHRSLEFVEEADSTCTTEGKKAHYICENEACHAMFSDAEGKTPVTADDLVIAKKAHKYETYVTKNDGTHEIKCNNCDAVERTVNCSYGEWTSNGNNTHSHTCKYCNYTPAAENCSGGTANCKDKAICDKCHEAYGEVNSDNHKSVVDVPGTDATCQTPGQTASKKCTACNEVIEASQTIDKLEHTFGNWTPNGDGTHTGTCTTCDPTVAEPETTTLDCSGGTATCKEAAKCTTCGGYHGETDPSNHASAETVLKDYEAATCTDAGFTGNHHYKCCGVIKTPGEEIPALNHSYTVELTETLVTSTCTTAGHVDYKCERCDEKTTKNLPLDPTNHSSTETVTVGAVAATCTTAGYTGDKYYVCCYDADKTAEQNKYALASKGEVIATNGSHSYTAFVPEYTLELDENGTAKVNNVDGVYSLVAKTGEITDADKISARHEDGKWYHVSLCASCGAVETKACFTYEHTYNCISTDICEDCGGMCSLTSPTKHNGGLEKVDAVVATCINTGVKEYYVCHEFDSEGNKVGCGHKYYDAAGTKLVENDSDLVTPIGPHSIDWENGEVTKLPTCGVNGETTYYCTVEGCDYSVTNADISSDGVHEWTTDEYKVVKEPTCFETGSKALYCKTCGAPKTGSYLTIPVIEHTWDEGTVTNEATCTEDGEKTYKCTFKLCDEDGNVIKSCEATKKETIKASGHKAKDEWVVVESTCSVRGYKYKVCENCDAEVERESLPLAAHSPSGNWIVIKQPTCSKVGIKQDSCTVCGKTYTEEIPTTDHKPIEVAGTEPSCTTPGKTSSVICDNCGTVIVEGTEIPADPTKHKDHDGDGFCDGCKYDMYEGACNCICHKEHWLMKFIYKIIRFFWKLFGISKTCHCGNVHY